MSELEPHACKVCDRPVSRRPHERVSKWRERKTCCEDCRIASLSRAPMEQRVLRTCSCCGAVVPKPPRLGWRDYARQATCNNPSCRPRPAPVVEHDMPPAMVEMYINRPSEKQLLAYREATPEVRRLFAPHIVDFAEARMGRG